MSETITFARELGDDVLMSAFVRSFDGPEEDDRMLVFNKEGNTKAQLALDPGSYILGWKISGPDGGTMKITITGPEGASVKTVEDSIDTPLSKKNFRGFKIA